MLVYLEVPESLHAAIPEVTCLYIFPMLIIDFLSMPPFFKTLILCLDLFLEKQQQFPNLFSCLQSLTFLNHSYLPTFRSYLVMSLGHFKYFNGSLLPTRQLKLDNVAFQVSIFWSQTIFLSILPSVLAIMNYIWNMP